MKVTQQKNCAARIGNVQLLATQLKSSVECGEGIVQRSIGPEILQAGHAVLGRCEELLTKQDIEVCRSQHFAYCVNLEVMNTLRGLDLGHVIEIYTDALQSSVEGRGLIKLSLSLSLSAFLSECSLIDCCKNRGKFITTV